MNISWDWKEYFRDCDDEILDASSRVAGSEGCRAGFSSYMPNVHTALRGCPSFRLPWLAPSELDAKLFEPQTRRFLATEAVAMNCPLLTRLALVRWSNIRRTPTY